MTIEAHAEARGQKKAKRKGTAKDFLRQFAPEVLAQRGGE